MACFRKVRDWAISGQARSRVLSIGIGVLLAVRAVPSSASEAVIINGQTLIIESRVVDLDGIDAPQTDQTCLDHNRALWNCGIAARDSLRAYITDRKI